MNHHVVRSVLMSCGVLLSCGAMPALADIPANEFRIGSETVFFREKADDISGPFVPPGVNLAVDNTETVYLAYVRRLWWNFSAELAFGVPPKTKTEGRGPGSLGSVPYDGQVISTARWLSPTLLINYTFLDESWTWRPYLGIGVNYTSFYDRVSTPAGDAAIGGPTRLSLTSSVGPAATAGFNYSFAPNWHLIASYSISKVKTHLTADTAGVERSTIINFGPQALVVAVGYSF
jgi:outer membrane protein